MLQKPTMTDEPTDPSDTSTESADSAPEPRPDSTRDAPEAPDTCSPCASRENRQYGRGQHPNSRRNLQSFTSATAPRTAGKSLRAARNPMSILAHLRALLAQDLTTEKLELQARRRLGQAPRQPPQAEATRAHHQTSADTTTAQTLTKLTKLTELTELTNYRHY